MTKSPRDLLFFCSEAGNLSDCAHPGSCGEPQVACEFASAADPVRDRSHPSVSIAPGSVSTSTVPTTALKCTPALNVKHGMRWCAAYNHPEFNSRTSRW